MSSISVKCSADFSTVPSGNRVIGHHVELGRISPWGTWCPV